MAKTASHLHQILLNDSEDKLKLGKITSASGGMLSATGYGTHTLLGKVLIVPSLLFDMIISVGCLDKEGYAVEISHGVAKIIGKNGMIAMLGFKNDDNVYTIQRLYPTNFFTKSTTSHDIRLPTHILNLTITPKANQSNSSTPNRVSWLYNTFTPQVNPLHITSPPPDADTPSPLQMIMPILDTDDTIISGPFSDNYTSHRSSNTSISEDLLTSRMRELSITPISSTRKRYQTVSTSTVNPSSTSVSTQTTSTIPQREMSHFGSSWNSNHPLYHDFLLDSGCTHHMVWNPHLFTNLIGNNDADHLGLGNVIVGHGPSLPIRGYGDIWPFGRVLYVPGITANILSCKMLCDHHGYSISFINNTATITDWCSMRNIMTAT
jgi:hypothetical protein